MRRSPLVVMTILVALICVRTALGHGGSHSPRPDREPGTRHEELRKVKIKVTAKGFEPSVVRVHAGERLTLLITRKTDKTCAKEIMMPSIGMKQDLPLDKTIRIYLGPQPAGRIAFACGMDMFKGEILVQD